VRGADPGNHVGRHCDDLYRWPRRHYEGTCCMKNEQGNIKTDSAGIKAIWRNYMEGLLNVENDWDQETAADCIGDPPCQVTQEEVRQAPIRSRHRASSSWRRTVLSGSQPSSMTSSPQAQSHQTGARAC